MKSFILALPASEVLRLLRAEIKSSCGQPELNTTCERVYVIDEDFDRVKWRVQEVEAFDLLTSVATLTIEPRVEFGYWVLSVEVERALGPLPVSEEEGISPSEITLEEFEAELGAPGRKRVTVRLHAESLAARRDFDGWLADMRARHPQ